MKRNWDTIRKILLAIEALPTLDSQLGSGDMAAIDSEECAYHMQILIESGLIVGSCREAIGPPFCFANRLTWKGHEFLDSIRDESMWNKIKLSARKQGISLSLDLIKDLSKILLQSLISTVV